MPIIIYKDNMDALFMATADGPTKGTRHMNTKLFVLQDWIKEEHVSTKELRTQYNLADQHNLGDQFTKAFRRIKFYEQTGITMGRRVPKYSPLYTGESSPPYRTTPCNTPKLPKVMPSSISAYNPTYELIKRLLPNSIFDIIGQRTIGSMEG